MNCLKIATTAFHGIAVATLGYGVYYEFTKMQVPPEFAAEISGFGGKLKYLTIWDVLLQFGFFLLCFVGDIRSLLTSKNQKKTAKQPNCVLDITFTSLVFPLGNFVALTFWSIWAVDRELILPASMDSFYPSWLNHVMHTSIVPFDFIELALVNHIFPSRSLGIAVLVLFMLTYLIWTFFIAYYGGFWVYPILAYLDWGSRSLFILGCVAITVILYLTGELCSYLVWGSTDFTGKVQVIRQPVKGRKTSQKKQY